MSREIERYPEPRRPRATPLARREAVSVRRAMRPSAAATNPFSAEEMRTLAQVSDALLAGPADSPWRASVPERVAALVARLPAADDAARPRFLLTLLELPPATLLMGGGARGFSAMTREQRQAALRTMATHPLGRVRSGFQTLKTLAALAYYADAPASGPNPVWGALGYPGPLASGPPVPRTIRTYFIAGETTLDCDVVVVGSGAGGGTVAGALAAAGLDVVVIEKGSHVAEEDFHQREMDSLRSLYLGGGLATTRDGAISILAGSCLGGGTVVGYTTAVRPPDDVRAEWDRLSGLAGFFQGADFDRALQAAEQTLGVNLDHSTPGRRDQLMEAGLKQLGWQVETRPRAVRGCTQDEVCGYCGLGCVRGAKRSTMETGLQDASDRGARVVVECEAEVVLVERGRAVGVVGLTATGEKVTVRAGRAVVLAAGALETPALLLRSGLDHGPVGERLRLHPTATVWGRFREEVRPWGGTLQARSSEQLARLHDGHGARFETVPVHPALLARVGAWESPLQFDGWMRQLPNLSPVGIVLRDRGAGRVGLDRAGRSRVEYRLSRFDRAHARTATEAAARVLEAAGAEEVYATPHHPCYVSYHQMGTAAMGANRRSSVVGPEGEAHAVKNLFVADASLLPSASGVGPLLTVTALAHHVAGAVIARG